MCSIANSWVSFPGSDSLLCSSNYTWISLLLRSVCMCVCLQVQGTRLSRQWRCWSSTASSPDTSFSSASSPHLTVRQTPPAGLQPICFCLPSQLSQQVSQPPRLPHFLLRRHRRVQTWHQLITTLFGAAVVLTRHFRQQSLFFFFN